MALTKIPLTDLALGEDEIVEVQLSRSPWGKPTLHVNINGTCALRVTGCKVTVDDRSNPERSAITIEPTNTPSLEDIVQHIRFGRVHQVAVIEMTHQAMVKIRALVDKHFPQDPPLKIDYVKGETSTACIIVVGGKQHIIAFMFEPRSVDDFVRKLPI